MVATRGAKATKNGKESKKEEETDPLTEDFISDMLKKHSRNITRDITAAAKESQQQIESTLEKVPQSISAIDERLETVEVDLESVKDRIDNLETRCAEMSASNSKLASKVVDLESRSRRQNIQILGLKEDTVKGQLTDFFSNLLMEVFGREFFATKPELDRAHRSLAPKPTSEHRSHSVILSFRYYQEKDHVIREARRKRNLNYLGQQIRLVEYFCTEVMDMRKEYREVMTELYKKGFKPALLYPARLRITLEDCHKQFLNSVDEARKVLDDSSLTLSSI